MMHNPISRHSNSFASVRHDSVGLAPARRWQAKLSGLVAGLVPGLVLAVAIAALATLLHHAPGLSLFSPMILAIVIGMAFHNIVGTPAKARAGVTFAMRPVLRFAIILLGFQISAQQIVDVGAAALLVIAMTLGTTFLFTSWLGKRLGVVPALTQLIAAGTSICGASAVIATNMVTRARDEDVAYAVACVTIFGSIAMLTYPLLPGMLDLDPHGYGLWAGASIHEIAQVIAAGFQDGQAAGEFATIAKLSRVLLLAPMVMAIGLWSARQAQRDDKGAGENTSRAKAPIPWFALGFVAMVGVNSCVTLPEVVHTLLVTGTGFLLATALAAMGLETDIAKLKAKGWRPFLLGLSAFLFIAGFSLLLVKLIA